MLVLRRSWVYNCSNPGRIFMPNTVKRISLYLTKEDLVELNYLMQKFGESQNAVFRRALILLNHVTLKNGNPQCANSNSELITKDLKKC